MAIDPVCKMEVDPQEAAAEAEYQGQTYYFCAPGCKATFEKYPERFLQETASDEAQGHQHHCCC